MPCAFVFSIQFTAHAQVNTDPMISVTGHLDVVVPPSIVDEESSASEERATLNQSTFIK